MSLSRTACALALLAALAAPLGADDSRERLRRLRPQPLAQSAADPRAAATRLVEADSRFAPLVSAHGAAWREALARRALDLEQRLRIDPLELSRPDLELPDWEWNRATPNPSAGSGWGVDALVQALFPPVPWHNLAARRPWFTVPTWPRIPWQGLVNAPRRSVASAVPPTEPPTVIPPVAVSYGIPWHGLVRYARPRANAPSATSQPWFPPIPWQGLVDAPPRTQRSHVDPNAGRLARGLIAVTLVLLALAAAYCAAVAAAAAAVRWFASTRARQLLQWLAAWLPGPLWRALLRWARALPAPEAPRRVAAGRAAGMSAAPVPLPVSLPTLPAGPAWDALPKSLFAEGRTREALRELLMLVLAVLDARGWIRYDPTLTNWDYRRQLPTGAPRDRFGELCRLFDRAWYGEREVDPVAYDRATALAAQLREAPR